MNKEMDNISQNDLKRKANRFNRYLWLVSIITAILLPATTTLIASYKLTGMGMELPSEAVINIASLWIFLFLIAYAITALIAIKTLSKIFDTEPQKLKKWRHIFVGWYTGLTISTAILLYKVYLTDIDPAKYKSFDDFEVVAATVFFAPIGMFIYAIPGLIIGALIGWIIWFVQGRPS